MTKSRWEEYYRNYKSLEYSWCWNNAPEVLKKQAFKEVLSAKEPSLIRKEMQRYGSPDEEQWEMGLQLREVILDLPSGFFKDESLEDVYQAALRMEISEIWKSNMGMSKIFRGQRRHEWKVIPRMFRVKSNSLDDNDSLTISYTAKIGGLVRQLQATDQAVNAEEGVAIVQHYSEELGVGTWLIDFTWDPFVALFFASYGGQDGDGG